MEIMSSNASRRSSLTSIAIFSVVVLMAGSGHAERRRAVPRTAPVPAIALDCNPAQLPEGEAELCRATRLREGKRLFESETFGGNGRTCSTCHSAETGTFSVSDVQRRLAANPSDPLFLHDALDGGVSGTSRIEQDATIRVTLPIPRHLVLVGQPSVTHLTFNRATPTTKNTPALDSRLMSDLRDSTLAGQALGAIRGHAQNTVEPTSLQLELIAEFEQSDARFFSSETLRRFAQKGDVPNLPEGTTDSERRGRNFFLDQRLVPPSGAGVCALCHSGPMLNEANVFSRAVFENPPGVRAFSVGVSERNLRGNPVYMFEVDDGLSTRRRITTPDIGILMSDLSAPFVALEIPPAGLGGPPRS